MKGDAGKGVETAVPSSGRRSEMTLQAGLVSDNPEQRKRGGEMVERGFLRTSEVLEAQVGAVILTVDVRTA